MGFKPGNPASPSLPGGPGFPGAPGPRFPLGRILLAILRTSSTKGFGNTYPLNKLMLSY